MVANANWRSFLDDEALTRGLPDPEARLLVDWIVERCQALEAQSAPSAQLDRRIDALRRRGRVIGRFVQLWCRDALPGAAGQLAAAEQCHWPFPTDGRDSFDVLTEILEWETRQEALG